MTPPSRQLAWRGGFTLTEMLLVLLIAALLAALTLPTVFGRGEATRRVAVNQLVALLDNARIAAGVEGRTYLVRIVDADDCCRAEVFTLDDFERRQPVTDLRWAQPVSIDGDARILCFAPDGSVLSEGEPVVRFGPAGCDVDATIELAGIADDLLLIDVRAPSGLVSLRRGRSATDAHEREELTAAAADWWQTHCRQVTP